MGVNEKPKLIATAATRAQRYVESAASFPVYPHPDSLADLDRFSTRLPDGPTDPDLVLAQLDELGSPATVRSTNGRYFGYVIGNGEPVATVASIIRKHLTLLRLQMGQSARGIDTWAMIASKRRSGVAKMVDNLCELADRMPTRLTDGRANQSTPVGLNQCSSLSAVILRQAASSKQFKRETLAGWEEQLGKGDAGQPV